MTPTERALIEACRAEFDKGKAWQQQLPLALVIAMRAAFDSPPTGEPTDAEVEACARAGWAALAIHFPDTPYEQLEDGGESARAGARAVIAGTYDTGISGQRMDFQAAVRSHFATLRSAPAPSRLPELEWTEDRLSAHVRFGSFQIGVFATGGSLWRGYFDVPGIRQFESKPLGSSVDALRAAWEALVAYVGPVVAEVERLK